MGFCDGDEDASEGESGSLSVVSASDWAVAVGWENPSPEATDSGTISDENTFPPAMVGCEGLVPLMDLVLRFYVALAFAKKVKKNH